MPGPWHHVLFGALLASCKKRLFKCLLGTLHATWNELGPFLLREMVRCVSLNRKNVYSSLFFVGFLCVVALVFLVISFRFVLELSFSFLSSLSRSFSLSDFIFQSFLSFLSFFLFFLFFLFFSLLFFFLSISLPLSNKRHAFVNILNSH